MVKTVFDANCWCERVDEETKKESGRATLAFEKAEADGKIVLDDEGYIKHQYCAARRGFGEKLFDIMFEAYSLRGRILISPKSKNQALGKALRDLGVPRSEHPYFHAANNVEAQFIVSEDIDFFDPSQKQGTAKAKAKAKTQRKGCVCKFARKSLGCEVICLEGYVAA